MKTKICKKCKVEKSILDFNKRSGNLDGLTGSCGICINVQRKECIKRRTIKIVNNKKCIICNMNKNSNEFGIDKTRTDGISSRCKECLKQFYNKEKKKEYYLNNIEYKAEFNKKYYIENKDKLKDQNKLYCENNKESIKCRRKIHSSENRNKLNTQRRDKYHLKLKHDLKYKLKSSIRTYIRKALKNYEKQNHSIELLGCTIEFLKTYLESKFTKGMSWENHGVKGWHIDHILPISSFDIFNEEDQRKCFHYTNLQPLWATTEIAMTHGEDSTYIGNLEKSNIIFVDAH